MGTPHSPPSATGSCPSAAANGASSNSRRGIAAGFPVCLRDTLPGLDNRNVQLLITAIRHAAGQRPPRR